MYQQEFENLLQQKLPKSLLLYGENRYLINSYIQYYISVTDASHSLLSQYYDEYSFESAKKYLSQSSLFGGTNLLIIKRDKKVAKRELDKLIELVNKNPNSYFVFEFEGLAKDAKSIQSAFNPKNGANWVRLFEPNMRQSIDILQKKAKKIALDIDYYALQHLLILLNNNLLLCANELDKLAILDGKVTSKDIDRLVYSTAPLATEQLLIELFEKRDVVERLSRLLELGEDEFSILRSTQFFVNQIFLFSAFKKLNGYIDSKAILGYKLPKQIEQQRANLALRVKSSSLLKIFEHLLEVELEMKKAPANTKELLLYGAFIKLQDYL